MHWLHLAGTVLMFLMIPAAVAMMIWPRLYGSRLVFIRWLGAFMVLTYVFSLADRFHLIG